MRAITWYCCPSARLAICGDGAGVFVLLRFGGIVKGVTYKRRYVNVSVV